MRFRFSASFFGVIMKMVAKADEFHIPPYLVIWHYCSSKIKTMCCMLISRGSLSIFYIKTAVFFICRLAYNTPMQMRSFLRLRFFFAFSFLFAFSFFFVASSFLCGFVLWSMRLRSLEYASSFFSKNENYVNLAVASTVPKFRRTFWSNKLTDRLMVGKVHNYNILGTTPHEN